MIYKFMLIQKYNLNLIKKQSMHIEKYILENNGHRLETIYIEYVEISLFKTSFEIKIAVSEK